MLELTAQGLRYHPQFKDAGYSNQLGLNRTHAPRLTTTQRRSQTQPSADTISALALFCIVNTAHVLPISNALSLLPIQSHKLLFRSREVNL